MHSVILAAVNHHGVAADLPVLWSRDNSGFHGLLRLEVLVEAAGQNCGMFFAGPELLRWCGIRAGLNVSNGRSRLRKYNGFCGYEDGLYCRSHNNRLALGSSMQNSSPPVLATIGSRLVKIFRKYLSPPLCISQGTSSL